MRRAALATLMLIGLTLASAPPAHAQVALPGAQTLLQFDPDGEPCTGVPNQLPGIFDFTAACQAHDACFSGGGDNVSCDQAFLQDMVAACVQQHPEATDPTRYACFTFAHLYYAGVRFFGGLTLT